jgi:hypothetical protein
MADIQLKDVAQLYVGCDCKHVGLLTDIFQMTAVQSDSDQVVIRNHKDRRRGQHTSVSNIKPILRPLSDMTEEEKHEFKELCNLEKEDLDCLTYKPSPLDGNITLGTAHLTNILQWAQGVNYLLKQKFDLFGLIDSNQALEKTKMK